MLVLTKLFFPSLSEISGPDVRLSLNRRLDESLIVFQRDTASDSGSCAQSDQSVISGSSANRTNRRSKRNRTTSTSEPTSNTSWYLYIQMQLCSQMSLRDWLSSKNHANSRPERAELYYMFWQIVDAVAYLHAHELMHRDLKPSNILFDSANRLKLADFGLVTSFADEDVNVAADYEACGGTGDVTRVLDYTTSAPGLVSSQKADKHGDSGHADSWSSSGDATDLSSNHVRHKYFGLRAARRQHTNDVGTDLYMSPEQVSIIGAVSNFLLCIFVVPLWKCQPHESRHRLMLWYCTALWYYRAPLSHTFPRLRIIFDLP